MSTEPRYNTTMMGRMAHTLHTLATVTGLSPEVMRMVATDAIQDYAYADVEPSSQETLARMERASNEFYGMATATGCHAFIEFAGLMNEFIKVCRIAEQQGIDWTQANTHTEVELPFAPHHVAYINEKLECVYQGLVLVRRAPEEESTPPLVAEAEKTHTLRATLTVSYDLGGGALTLREMESLLESNLRSAISNGALTGDTEAEVEEWSLTFREVV